MTASYTDSWFVLRNLISTDFKVRYRNMSLGIFWSLVNPLVMMGVLTFCFTQIMRSEQRFFPLFVLMGLLPYNFFTLAWANGANSIVGNAALVKKVPFMRPAGDTPEETALNPFSLRGILNRNGFEKIRIVPCEFVLNGTPPALVPFCEGVSRVLERLPLLRLIGGSVRIFAEKAHPPA